MSSAKGPAVEQFNLLLSLVSHSRTKNGKNGKNATLALHILPFQPQHISSTSSRQSQKEWPGVSVGIGAANSCPSNWGIALPDLPISIQIQAIKIQHLTLVHEENCVKSHRNGPEMDQSIENSVTICAAPDHPSLSEFRPTGRPVGDRFADVADGNRWQPMAMDPGPSWTILDHPGEPPSLGRSPRLPVAPAVHLLQLSLPPPGS